MGLGIIIPVVVIAIGMPLALAWANKTFKGGPGPEGDVVHAPAARLTLRVCLRLRVGASLGLLQTPTLTKRRAHRAPRLLADPTA